MKTFLIAGAIVDQDIDRWSYEDVTPDQVRSFLDGLEDGEEALFEINSPGGSCSAGISICNLIKQARLNGHKITVHVIGLAASIASVIACSGDELQMDSNAFMMIHLPYLNITGNSNELEKTVEVLKQNEQAIISVYKTKFDLTDEQLLQLMVEETWFLGSEKDTYKLNATVIENITEYKIAACIKNLEKDYKKIPNKLKDLYEVSKMPEDKNTEQPKNETVETVENRTEEMISVSECEKRVSGMQSTMAKQIEALKKEHETIVNDLKVQIETKDKELTKAQADVTSLNASLEKVTNELQNTVSALDEKQKALETLNANVNTTPEELPTFQEGLAKCKTPKEKVDFINSGKYTK